jgi:hypothetical protein
MVHVVKQKKGKKKRMESRVEEVDGGQFLIVTDGDRVHQIDLGALSSWGMLLGLTDEAEIVRAILRFQDTPAKPGEPNMWTPLYDALGRGLDELSRVGVPPEFVEDVMNSDAPFPAPETAALIESARAAGRAAVEAFPDVLGADATTVTDALAGHCDKVKAGRVGFVDQLAPVYELPPAPAP